MKMSMTLATTTAQFKRLRAESEQVCAALHEAAVRESNDETADTVLDLALARLKVDALTMVLAQSMVRVSSYAHERCYSGADFRARERHLSLFTDMIAMARNLVAEVEGSSDVSLLERLYESASRALRAHSYPTADWQLAHDTFDNEVSYMAKLYATLRK